MRSLSTSELLEIWERGLSQTPPQRALSLLAAVFPEIPPLEIAKLNVGIRDSHLIAFHESTFGSRLNGLLDCPSCGEHLELVFETADVSSISHKNSSETMSLDVQGYEVKFRLPNSLDLLAISECNELTAARSLLAERCILGIITDGEEAEIGGIPKDIIDAVAARMSLVDPQAYIKMDFSCPMCDHHWNAAFDIVTFLWSEIDAFASRTLREVHLLARSYGWAEADILTMSPWRRQLYLEALSE